MNSNFTASSPFYHLQQSLDGTSILRNALRHTGGGLRCMENGYKRKGIPQKKGMNILMTNRTEKRTVYYLV